MRQLLVDLSRPAARLLAPEAQTGVDRDPVEPGRKGGISPEALHVRPDPDPDILARVLGLLPPQHAKRHPAHEGRVGADQLRERLDVAAGGAGDQRPLFGAHRRFSSLEAFRGQHGQPGYRTGVSHGSCWSIGSSIAVSSKKRSRQVSIALHGLQYLAQQSAGEFLAARIHYPIDPASSRYSCAPHPRADYIGLELRILAVVAGEMVQQRAHRAVEQGQVQSHTYPRFPFAAILILILPSKPPALPLRTQVVCRRKKDTPAAA